MPIVKTDVPQTAENCSRAIRELTQRYPFCRSERLGETAFGRPIETLVIGDGPRRVLFTAAHHANEWITATVLLKFVEDLAAAAEKGAAIAGTDARSLLMAVTIHTVPMVDPDGVTWSPVPLHRGHRRISRLWKLPGNFQTFLSRMGGRQTFWVWI